MQTAPETLARVKDDWLQLAYLGLRKDKRDLVLLATIDLGPQDYFDRIVQLIKKREKRGFAIVYEDLEGMLGLKQRDGDGKELHQLKQRAMSGLQKHGITFLADVVRPEDYWTKVSATEVENGSDDFDAGQHKLAETLRAIQSDPEATVQALRSLPAPRELHDFYPVASATQLAARVAAAMLEQAARYHAFANAGLHRAPAVIDALTTAGYEIVQQHWMDVMVVTKGGQKGDAQ